VFIYIAGRIAVKIAQAPYFANWRKIAHSIRYNA
jgi:hypothetical protein